MANPAIKDWVDRIKAELAISSKPEPPKAGQPAAPRPPQSQSSPPLKPS